MLKALLQFYKGDREVSVPMDRKSFLIGRGLQSDIRLLDDSKVSRKHCSIKEEKGGFYITDLGSSNGTYVNDTEVETKQELHEHDKIRIGDREFLFMFDRRKGTATEKITKIIFCVTCGGSITYKEIKEGNAGEGDQGYICSECSGPDSMTGHIFLNYDIRARIAQGGMGIVYRAEHRVLKTTVALKLIREGKDTDKNIIERFMREVRLGSMVKHPNIIEFIDAGEHDGVKYLIMEYCEGESLEKRLKEGGTIDADIFPHVALQVLNSVAAVHGAELVHRDIKPDNILLADDNTVKLIDFGLVKDLDPESISIITQAGSAVGTPCYMSPEQVRESGTPDVRSDIYSIGATFYRILCGEPPVTGTTPVEFLKNLDKASISHPSEMNSAVSREAGDMVMKALEKNPEDRYEDVQAFISCLENTCGV